MSIRPILISAIALAMLPAAILRASDTVEYVGGTVKSIPMNSIGFLNVDDTKVLKFSFGQAMYKLPYDQITGTEVTKSESRHIMKKFPVPTFGRKKETLTISYKDPAGETGKLSFELNSRLASSIQDTISEQKAAPLAEAANPSNDWWGDKFWRTNSNKAAWDTSTAAATKSPAPATTKN